MTKNKLLLSALSLILCLAMLIGTTFAWFTDSAISAGNIIESGELKVTMEWADKYDSATWTDASEGAIFTHENWEPGYTEVKYIKITNEGELNLKWKLTVEADGEVSILSDVIDVYYVNPASGNLESLDGLTTVGNLTAVLNDKIDTTGSLVPEESTILAIAFHMDENAGNEYQELTLCEEGFSVKLIATQDTGESDSFGDDYDAGAEWPDFEMNFSATKSLEGVNTLYGALTSDVIIRHSSGAYAVVPAGTKLADGVTELEFSGKNATKGNIKEEAKSYDIHIEGIADDNEACITVYIGAILPEGLSDTEVKLYHEDVQMTRVNSVADFSINNQFTYDPATGSVVLYVNNFSVFSAVQATASVWTDDTVADTSWYNENDTEFVLKDVADFLGFRDLVDAGNNFAGITVTLASDIDLNNKLFNPIGGGWAYNNGQTFNGTFDGGNHTIYNLYANGWELDATGDNHSSTSKGAGLFSSIHNATIKNLAVVGSELVVETTSIGIIAGCAQGKCTFENIIVSNATLGNYQMRNGGIVGDIYVIESDGVSEGEYSHTFKNIVVDSSVKLSSMWGDFDTGNGGVIGGKYGSAKVLMENVVVAAELDVFSDVTAAYQWYAYRRCGMLVGYTGQNSPKQATNAAADFLTCENVNVYYGEWTNYTYYQFNNQDSATGRRYPWVRAESSPYNGAFSNVRYGVPTFDGVKVSEMDEATLNQKKSGFAAITFNQLYGGGQGVYGCADHKNGGVTTYYSLPKTFYIVNNFNWDTLKVQYNFKNGDDIWETTVDGIELVKNNGVYRVDIPQSAYSFTIIDGLDHETDAFIVSELTEKATYTLDGKIPAAIVNDTVYGSLQDAINAANGDIITLLRDITLTSSLKVNNGTRVTLDLNGKTIEADTPDQEVRIEVLLVDGEDSEVTICGNGTMLAKGDAEYVEVISAINHGKVTIENGTFISDGCTAIYATTNAIVNIQGGYYEAKELYEGKNYLIDVNELISKENWGKIIITGGSFVGFDPANHNNDGADYTNKLARGLHSIKNDNNYEVTTEHNFIDGECACGYKTFVLSIKDYASSNGWEDAKQYKTVEFNDHISANVVGGGNTGKYYTNGNNWRLYQTENAKLQFNSNGANIISIKVTYTSDKNGTLIFNGENISSGTKLNIISDMVQLNVGNTSSENNGQVRVTEIEIVYDCISEDIDTPESDSEKETDLEVETDSEIDTDTDTESESDTPTESGWIKTDLTDIKADDVVVIVWTTSNGTSYAPSNHNGTSSAPSAVVVTVQGDKLTGDINDNIKWNISNNNGNLTIYPDGTTEKWLYCTSTNNGVRVGTNNNKVFTIDASSGYLKNNATNRYLGVYTTNPDIRCYTSTTTNIQGQTLSFYVLTGETSSGSEGNEPTTPDTTVCEHTNKTITSNATCTTAGTMTVTCDDCGEISTEEIPAKGHNYNNGICDVCGEKDPNAGSSTEPADPITLATFEFGANGSASHSDGSEKISYTETNNGYTLELSGMSKVYGSARDAKGNSCLKLGTGSAAGKFSFTVPEDVTSVVIYIAKYKDNTSKVTINGTTYTLTKNSDNGEYDEITIDTTSNKTITLTTVSGGYRAMLNAIEFMGTSK